MNKTILTIQCLLSVMFCHAQSISGYKSLGTKAFFIDCRFSDEEAAKYPFVFNSVNKAIL